MPRRFVSSTCSFGLFCAGCEMKARTLIAFDADTHGPGPNSGVSRAHNLQACKCISFHHRHTHTCTDPARQAEALARKARNGLHCRHAHTHTGRARANTARVVRTQEWERETEIRTKAGSPLREVPFFRFQFAVFNFISQSSTFNLIISFPPSPAVQRSIALLR
jgi:hypothetical protein